MDAGSRIFATDPPVILRCLHPDDLEPFQAYRTDPEVARYQDWARMDDTAARDFLTDMSDVALARPGRWTQFAIANASDNRLMGDMGIFLSEDQDWAELGITLARAHQGQGIGTMAFRLCAGLILDQYPVTHLRASCDIRNNASRTLLARVGFAETGTRVTDVTEATFRFDRLPVE